MQTLRSARAVRERAREILAAGERDALSHFRVNRQHLARVATYVADAVRERYPALEIPLHSRWRHFECGGRNRWSSIVAAHSFDDRREQARAALDLTVVSVLLDAGAGPNWCYHEMQTGQRLTRSEGLAIASLDLFRQGAFSSDPAQPLRVDRSALESFDLARLADGFQVTVSNPLLGLEGRLELLRALGSALAAHPAVFGEALPRFGNLVDALLPSGEDSQVGADHVLTLVLDTLSDIWPGRLTLGGVALGDVWHHPAIQRNDATDGLMPFHKLSQWLCYSLIEPLQHAGITVANVDELTGLAEYRNGGLLLDLELIELRDPQTARVPHAVDSELVVEWRALTVALLDELAVAVRDDLGVDRSRLPLGCILEGGTWWAGRQIAAARRADGGPPLQVISDGTVF